MSISELFRISSIDRMRKREEKSRAMLMDTIANICDEIHDKGTSKITMNDPNRFQISVDVLDLKNLDFDFYNPDIQAKLVRDYLIDAETVSQFDRKITGIVSSGGIKNVRGFHKLNAVTLGVIRKYA